jgi:hypothetical protein
MDLNTKFSINKKIIYLAEPKDKSIGQNLFNSLLEFSQEFIMNDDGSKFKKQLSKFEVSSDKTFGRFWHFKINSESKKILPTTFDYYLNKEWGHWFWSLKGKDFTIEYQECGDEITYPEMNIEGPNGKMSIYNDFKVEAREDSLKIIKEIISKYQK